MRNGAGVPGQSKTAVRHDIPSLDGLRAVAIAIVLLAHTGSLLPPWVSHSGVFRYLIGGGLHGVQVFFVISGYLITTLLIREFDQTGEVSLRRFYARRMLRIFPPFYLYLAVVSVLWAMRIEPQDLSTFLSAATYTIVYHPHPRGWLVQHAWSLSIEEQFYLLWPALLVVAHRRVLAGRVAMTVLVLMPIARGLILIAVSGAADHMGLIVKSGSIDSLLTGCLLALLAKDIRWRQWCQRWITIWTVLGACALGLVVTPYIQVKLDGTLLAIPVIALGYSATALSLGAALEYFIRVPQSLAGRLLNLTLVRHVGVISYSIYLWQQIFTGSPMRFGWFTYPLILITAEASFWLVERPLMRARASLHFGAQASPGSASAA